MRLSPGDIAFESYEVLEHIGSGGMGSIYKAKHTLMERVVVLKVLAAEHSTVSEKLRFQSEAKLLSQLKHSNIAKIFDFGVSDDGNPFLAIEFIEGKTLQQLIEESGPLKVEECCAIAAQIADALNHAHSSGIIHRDLKPGNVMIDTSSKELRAVLLDFGIAKICEDDAIEIQKLTTTGALVGSPAYMSPEQCQAVRKLTPASDLYSLGCLIFSMVTGDPPLIKATTIETMSATINEPPPPLVTRTEEPIPEELEELVSRLLEKRPEDRPESASIVKDKLMDFLETEDAVVEGTTVVEILKKKPAILLTALVPLCAVIAAFIFFGGAGQILKFMKADVETAKDKAPISGSETIESVNSLPKSAQDSDEVKRPVRWKLDLIEQPIGSSLRNLSHPDDVKVVNLEFSEVSRENLAELVKFPIVSLNLAGTKISSLKDVGKLKYLRKLDLEDTNIDDADLVDLKNLRMIEELNLKGTQVTEKGLENLRALTSLCIVTLPSNIPEKSVTAIAEKMQLCAFPGYVAEAPFRAEIRKRATKRTLTTEDYKYFRHRLLQTLGPCAAVAELERDEATVRWSASNATPILSEIDKAIEKTLKTGNIRSAAISKQIKAHILESMGKLKEAINTRKEAIEDLKLTLSPQDLPLTQAIVDYGARELAFGDYKAASESLGEAENFLRAGAEAKAKESYDLKHALGDVYRIPSSSPDRFTQAQIKESNDKAEKLFNEIRELLEAMEIQNEDYGLALATTAAFEKDPDRRIEDYRRSIEILKARPGDFHAFQHLRESAIRLSEIYDSKSEYEKAIACLQAAIHSWETQLPSTRPKVDDLKSMIAEIRSKRTAKSRS